MNYNLFKGFIRFYNKLDRIPNKSTRRFYFPRQLLLKDIFTEKQLERLKVLKK